MLKFDPTPLLRPFNFQALRAFKKARKSLQIGGQIGAQPERDTVIKISDIVDFIGLCGLGYH